MELLDWKEEYSVGIEDIDRQHKKLISIINQLKKAMLEGNDREAMSRTFFELVKYTIYHFTTEEEYFDQYSYPKKEDHKNQHNKFVREVYDLQGKFDSGEDISASELMNFLHDWWNNHIICSDKKYEPFLKSQGV